MQCCCSLHFRHADLSVHFDSKTVGGTAEVSVELYDLRRLCLHASFELNQIFVHMQLHVSVNQSGTAELLLDTRDLIINSVIDKLTGQDLPFKFAEEHKVFATCLDEAGSSKCTACKGIGDCHSSLKVDTDTTTILELDCPHYVNTAQIQTLSWGCWSSLNCITLGCARRLT